MLIYCLRLSCAKRTNLSPPLSSAPYGNVMARTDSKQASRLHEKTCVSASLRFSDSTLIDDPQSDLGRSTTHEHPDIYIEIHININILFIIHILYTLRRNNQIIYREGSKLEKGSLPLMKDAQGSYGKKGKTHAESCEYVPHSH